MCLALTSLSCGHTWGVSEALLSCHAARGTQHPPAANWPSDSPAVTGQLGPAPLQGPVGLPPSQHLPHPLAQDRLLLFHSCLFQDLFAFRIQLQQPRTATVTAASLVLFSLCERCKSKCSKGNFAWSSLLLCSRPRKCLLF